MTSYFDTANREVSDAPREPVDFLKALQEIEARVKADVRANLADADFPADLKPRIEKAIIENELMDEHGNVTGDRDQMAVACRNSDLLGALHSAFHELARRRVKARFTAWWSDDPAANNRSRERWEATPPEER